MKLDILDIHGQKTGKSAELSDSIFAIEPNDHAIYLAVKQFLANKRQGTHKAKEKSELSGSTRKLHRQKGTGGSRKGSIKNPLFKGGARVHGPRPRDYSFKLNKKVKDLARKSALTYKAADSNLIVVDQLTFDGPKTRNITTLMQSLGIADNKVLFLLPTPDRNVVLSGRNLPRVSVDLASNMNTYDILNCQKLVMTTDALEAINQMLTETEVAN